MGLETSYIKPPIILAAHERLERFRALTNAIYNEELKNVDEELKGAENELKVLENCLENTEDRIKKNEDAKTELKLMTLFTPNQKAEHLRKEKIMLERKREDFKEQIVKAKEKISKKQKEVEKKDTLETHLFLLLQEVFSSYYPNMRSSRVSEQTMTSEEKLMFYGSSKQQDQIFKEDYKLYRAERIANQKFKDVQTTVDNIRNISDQLRKTGQDLKKAHDLLRKLSNADRDLISGVLTDKTKAVQIKLAEVEPYLIDAVRHFENAYSGVGVLMQQRRRQDITNLATAMGTIPQRTWKQLIEPLMQLKARITGETIDVVADKLVLNIKRVNFCLSLLFEIKTLEVEELDRVRKIHRSEAGNLIEYRSTVFNLAITLYDTTFMDIATPLVKGKGKVDDKEDQRDSFAKYMREIKAAGKPGPRTDSKPNLSMEDPSFKGSEDSSKQENLNEPVVLPTIEPLTPQSSTFWRDAQNRLMRPLGNFKREREQTYHRDPITGAEGLSDQTPPNPYRSTPEPPSTDSEERRVEQAGFADIGMPRVGDGESNSRTSVNMDKNRSTDFLPGLLDVIPSNLLMLQPYNPESSDSQGQARLDYFENLNLDMEPFRPQSIFKTILPESKKSSTADAGEVLPPHLYHDFDSSYPISSPSPALSVGPTLPLPPNPTSNQHSRAPSVQLPHQRALEVNSSYTHLRRSSEGSKLSASQNNRYSTASSRRSSVISGPPPDMPLPPPPVPPIPPHLLAQNQRSSYVPNLPLPSLPKNKKAAL